MARRAAREAMAVRLSLRICRVLMHAFPAWFQRRYRDPLLQHAADFLQDEYRRAGTWGVVRVWPRLARDLVGEGLAERAGRDPSAPAADGRGADARPDPPSRHDPTTSLPRNRSHMLDTLTQELRFALRSLRRRPGFTVVAAVTLALGIGATTAIFTVVRGVLLQPLPYPEPEGLVMAWVAPDSPDGRRGVMSWPDIADLERQAPSLETLIGVSTTTATLTGLGEPMLIDVARLSNGLLATFRLAPALGRDIRADEFGAGAARVVVVGNSFWRQQLGGRPDAIGGTLTLDQQSFEVVGVAPPGFAFPDGSQLWIPRRIDPEGCGRGCHTWQAVGRLASGATLEAAQAEADAIAANLSEAYPESNFEKRFELLSLRDQIVGDVETGLWLLLGAVAAVLLIACANVANLMLARASTRRGEVAIRAALGASRGRLAAALLLESSLLALLGGALGLLLAGGGVALLRATSAGTLPRVDAITVDGTVLLFTAGLVVAVTLLFGLSPALRLAGASLSTRLTASGRGADGGRRGRRVRTLLTAAEMGLSVVLLIGAGLLLRTFAQLYGVDPGFETREVVRFNVGLPEARYSELEQVRTFFRSLEERLHALPGVESVGSVYGAPLGRGSVSGEVLVEGRPEPERGQETYAAVRAVSPGYLQTLRIPLLRGRPIVPADDAGGLPVAVVNETFVRQNFPDRDPLGERIEVTVDMGYGSPVWTIVGVVGDVRARALTRDPGAEVYVPHGHFGPEFLTVNVRSTPGTGNLLGPIRDIVRSMDPELPLQNVETLTEVIDRQVAPTRFFLLISGLFAVLAGVLAAIGLYGVMAYLVSRRRREIGVRIALGAHPGGIVRMVLVDGLRPTLAGVAVGLAIALAGGRVLEGLLYGITPRDPWILVSVPALLSLVALAAILLPASRASRVDPVEALRSE